MKKITKLIISFTIIISSLSTTFAEEWYIEKLLDLNYGIEEYELNLSEIKYIHFKNQNFNKIYNELKTADSVLKKWFMRKYRNWELEYYKINWIIKNYNNFVYHTNQFFLFLKLKEQRPYYKETTQAILTNYKEMRNSYKKVKNIIKSK